MDVTASEKKIFEAAKGEFTEKGFDGARMQSIADRAQISKAALHYYYRSKQLLFNKVVQFSFSLVFQNIQHHISASMPFWDKVQTIIDLYIDTLSAHRKIAFFVFSELMKHPGVLDQFVDEGQRLEPLFATYRAEITKGTVRDMEPRHLLLSIISMSIYPILGEPLVKRVYRLDNPAYETFLNERKSEIFSFVKHALRP